MNRDYSIDTHSKASPHLTTEQLGEILDGSRDGVSSATLAAERAHLESCEICRSEFDSLREALALFRESTAAFSSQQFTAPTRERVSTSRMLSRSGSSFPHSLAWAAAGLLAAAASLPLGFHLLQQQRRPAVAAAISKVPATAGRSKGESDAALLDDINRELSASVPDSMQALADPAAISSGADATSPMTRKN